MRHVQLPAVSRRGHAPGLGALLLVLTLSWASIAIAPAAGDPPAGNGTAAPPDQGAPEPKAPKLRCGWATCSSLGEARTALLEKHPAKALAIYQSILKTEKYIAEKFLAEAQFGMGVAYLSPEPTVRNLVDARDAFEQFVKQYPQHPDAAAASAFLALLGDGNEMLQRVDGLRGDMARQDKECGIEKEALRSDKKAAEERAASSIADAQQARKEASEAQALLGQREAEVKTLTADLEEKTKALDTVRRVLAEMKSGK